MRTKKFRISSFIVLALILAIGAITPAFAEDDLQLGEDYTIDMEEVLMEWNKAEKVPLEMDKGSDDEAISLDGMGTYPRRKGVILVTPDKFKGIIPTGHAAIIYTNKSVVESLAKGVTMGENDWNRQRKQCYGVTVRGTSEAQDSNAANWCYRQRGKRYNFNYLNVSTRKSFYCSHLVWAAFKDLYKIDLNTSAFGAAVHPMELVNTSRTLKIYQK